MQMNTKKLSPQLLILRNGSVRRETRMPLPTWKYFLGARLKVLA